MLAPPIRIEHVLLSLRPGGLENGVINVINGIDRRRFQSSVCCLVEAGEFASRIEAPAVAVHTLGLKGGIDLSVVRRLARHFRATRPDIVHTRNPESFFYGCLASRLAGVPRLVHSEHGRTFADRKLRLHAQRWLSRFAHAIFAVSNQLKGDLVKHVGIPSSRIEVLYNGVDLERFALHAPSTAVREELGIAPGSIVVGSVGRLVPVKNYALLLKAVAAASLPDLHLVLVGDGPERARLASLAQELGIAHRVHLPGHRDDVSRLLSALDVFVLPSLSEGLSNTLLEAMAQGVAPIVSDVGGNVEIVESGVTGEVFQSGNEAMLVGRLRSLCENPATRRRLGQAAHLRVQDAFGMNRMIARYEDLYARMAEGAHRC